MRTECAVCGSTNLRTILNIADQPLSRYGLVKIKNHPVRCFPIKIVKCVSCSHMQNIAYIEGTVDYTDEEIKESRTYSEKMKLFLNKQSYNLINFLKKDNSNASVLEIGCGDGYFLSKFSDFSVVVGFEPSPEGKLALEKGITLIDSYFSLNKLDEFESFDIVVLRQVLEHIENPKIFINEIKSKIAKEGLIYLEVPNGSKSINKNRFHDFYYEHVYYFTKSSLILLLENEGFEVINCKSEYDEEIITAVARFHKHHAINDLPSLTDKIRDVQTQVQGWLNDNKKIVGWGTAGNGSLFFSLLGITDQQIKYVVDSDKRKQGLFLPITNQMVIPPSDLIKINPDVVIVLSQFHSEEIIIEARKLIGDKIIVNFFN